MDNLLFVSILSMTGLSMLFAGVLAFADKKLRVEEDPMITKVAKLLPQANCAACGFLSCHDFAEHIVKEGEDPAKCRVLGEEAKEELFGLLGKEDDGACPVIALVRCSADAGHKKPVADYHGVETCMAANVMFGGGIQCQYGCIGKGDCVNVCPFDAIYMENGLPVVDTDKCTGCGNCARACPRGIITMQEKKFDKLYYVACSSKDNALRVRQVCGVGCLGCGICEKLSPEGFFKVEDLLSRADFNKQDKPEEIEKLQAKCPTRVIRDL